MLVEMFGKTLVTQQTGPNGKAVNQLYVEDGADIDRELYLSILVDRETGKTSFVASTEGGMDIETVAHETPELIHSVGINASAGCTDADAATLADAFKLEGISARTGHGASQESLRGLCQQGYEPFGNQPVDRHQIK